jgi:NAD/NADP transhydrogenase beta subunit
MASPIYGIPILNVDHARSIIVTLRSLERLVPEVKGL